MAWIADCSTFLRVGQKLKIMLQYKLLTKYHTGNRGVEFEKYIFSLHSTLI